MDVAGVQGYRRGVTDGPERWFESRWKMSSNAFLLTKLCSSPFFKVCPLGLMPRKRLHVACVLRQASEERQLPYMLNYKATRISPKFIPQKRGLLHFECLHSFTCYGALVQLLYFEKLSSGWGMHVRLKHPVVFWTLLKVICKIDGKEITEDFVTNCHHSEGRDLTIVRAVCSHTARPCCFLGRIGGCRGQ